VENANDFFGRKGRRGRAITLKEKVSYTIF
jgi:hypothetical protein